MMSEISVTSRQRLYLSSVLKFARTFVIKSDMVARAINVAVAEKTGDLGVDATPKETWKYFLNVCGLPHHTDKPMMIKSLDDGSQILFSKQNLEIHPVTKQAYEFESYYYRDLLARFPDQEDLILGTLYPANMAKAVAAKDGTILAMDESFVEPHEVSLIEKIQEWLYFYVLRWTNSGYQYGNDLYASLTAAQTVANLVQAILVIRHRACKTSEVHSFHLSEYLRSKGLPGFAVAMMTRRQQLLFYRNINRFQRTSGQRQTMLELIDVLFTEQGMPAYEYDFAQADRTIRYVNPNEDTQLLAAPRFARNPLNKPAQDKPLNAATFLETIALLDPLTEGNPNYHQFHAEEVRWTLKTASRSNVKTKVIETTLDLTKAENLRAPVDTLMEQWIYTASSGAYKRPISYTPPAAAIPLELSQEQAVALWFYFLQKSILPLEQEVRDRYEELDQVPMFPLTGVFRETKPSKQQILDILPTNTLRGMDIDPYFDLFVEMPSTISTHVEFRRYCDEVYRTKDRLMTLYSFEEDWRTRAYGQIIAEAFTTDRFVKLPSLTVRDEPYEGKNYLQFLEQVGFKSLTYGRTDYAAMAEALFKEAVGLNLEDLTNPETIQRAMIDVFRRLSSYSIAIVSADGKFGTYDDLRPCTRINLGSTSADGNIRVHFDPLDAVVGELNVPAIEDKRGYETDRSINVTFSAELPPIRFPMERGGIRHLLVNDPRLVFKTATTISIRSEDVESYDLLTIDQKLAYMETYHSFIQTPAFRP